MPSPKFAHTARPLSADDSAQNPVTRRPTAMIRESLNSRFDIALSELEARTCHSWKMALDRSKVIAAPSGNTSRPQIIIRSANGCRITDIDENEYIDLTMGYGANLLGHSPDIIEQAILSQTRKGWNFGLDGESQLELAELINAVGPANQRVQLCATGNEATALAMRAARAFTGKDSIGVFAGAYHGSHDYALITTDPKDPNAKAHIGLGIPEQLNSLIEPLPYGTPAAFQRIEQLRSVLAAVIVEAVQGSAPFSDGGQWLRELQQVCTNNGVLLILDEGLTGFRLAYGGAQEHFDVTPDLVTYGKAIAGGLPMGVLAGREDVMHVFSPGKHRPSVFAGGTFVGNPLSVAAGVATLTYLRKNHESFYSNLDALAARLATDITAYWRDRNAPLHVMQYGSLLRIFFQTAPGVETTYLSTVSSQGRDAFFVHMLNQGVALHASGNINLSEAHTAEDLETVSNAIKYATDQAIADGLLGAH